MLRRGAREAVAAPEVISPLVTLKTVWRRFVFFCSSGSGYEVVSRGGGGGTENSARS